MPSQHFLLKNPVNGQFPTLAENMKNVIHGRSGLGRDMAWDYAASLTWRRATATDKLADGTEELEIIEDMSIFRLANYGTAHTPVWLPQGSSHGSRGPLSSLPKSIV